MFGARRCRRFSRKLFKKLKLILKTEEKMDNAKKNTKKAVIITITAVLAAALIIVPLVIIFTARKFSPIDFLMKEDLSAYVDVETIESMNYDELREPLKSGYDVFRVSITETYFGTSVYIEEGSTLDFTLSAELVTEKDGTTEYTQIELPDEYSKVIGYRPYSNKDNLFFDKALSQAGSEDDYGSYYLTRDSETKFNLTLPEIEAYGEYAGKTLRFTIKVTDYVARYIYLYNGSDNSVTVVSDWFCRTVAGITEKSSEKIEAGDIIIYDCTDKYKDGTKDEFKDLCLEVDGEYVEYFEGYAEGDTFSEDFGEVTTDFTVKAVFKRDDADEAIKKIGYDSAFDLREELRIWCYAVYSDGLTVIATENAEVLSYPEKLISVYTKLEDATWETEFRESAASFADTFGDDTALSSYGITGFETMEDYLDDLLKSHVETLVRELLVTYYLADDLGVLDELYARYEKSLEDYIESGDFSSRSEALESLYANGDEACIFYTNFISPILGVKYAGMVTGVPFAEYIADSYAS